MKSVFFLIVIAFLGSCSRAPKPPMSLGLTYTVASSSFRLWATEADSVRIFFYADDLEGTDSAAYSLHQNNPDQWELTLRGDYKGAFYAFKVYRNGSWSVAVPDPNAKALGTNGKRAQVVDLKATDPAGWESDRAPEDFGVGTRLIYEMHIRDATIHPAAKAENPGTFIGLANSPVVLDHIASLGVTHVHLLPFFDYASVDETRLNEPQYNWGYDPLNYNAPEGSYSTDPSDGSVRIRELKTLIQTMHEKGLRVVMDVVYNHTRFTENSSFEVMAPGQYFRQNEEGMLSNASGCGNEVASEHPEVRAFIIESLKYWMTEYHLDGFRFDLMGIHDIETMNQVEKELRGLRPDVLLYGEGWKAGSSPLLDEQLALKANALQFPGVGVFSDDLRDGVKGSVFNEHDLGWVQGNSTKMEDVKFGLVGAVPHTQVNIDAVSYSNSFYANQPDQMIAYVSCHDNLTLWDKLSISLPNESDSIRRRRHQLAMAIVLLSQGTPFIHAGSEFYRTKYGVENSYESPDSINELKWNELSAFPEGSQWVRELISFRKEVGIGSLYQEELANRLTFLDTSIPSIIAFNFKGLKEVLVVLNSGYGSVGFPLPNGLWVNEKGVSYSDQTVIPGTGVLLLSKS